MADDFSDGGLAALFDAIAQGDVAAVVSRVKEFPGLLGAMDGYHHHLPLHHAAYWGQAGVALALLGLGADVHARGGLGRTALHVRCVPGTPGVAELLIEAGADVHARDEWGATPLFYAESPACAEVLCASGANADTRRRDGQRVINGPAGTGKIELLRVLLENGARPDRKDHLGWTPLMWAVWNGHAETADLLLAYGARLKSKDGQTLLHVAAGGGHRGMVEHLLAQGADIHARDSRGWDALEELAALCDGEEDGERRAMMECLLAHGADVNGRDKEGWTCLHYALANGSAWLWPWLLEKGATVDIFAMAGLGEVTALERELAARPECGTMRDGAGYTLLHWAACVGRREVLELLLARAVDVDAADNNGNTPLHLAAERSCGEAVEALLAAGADCGRTNEQGNTPLMDAAWMGHGEMVRRLAVAGAAVGGRDKAGWTPLCGAAWVGNQEMVELLLSLGAQVNAITESGRTALDAAMGQKHAAVAAVLKAHGGKRGWVLRRKKPRAEAGEGVPDEPWRAGHP